MIDHVTVFYTIITRMKGTVKPNHTLKTKQVISRGQVQTLTNWLCCFYKLLSSGCLEEVVGARVGGRAYSTALVCYSGRLLSHGGEDPLSARNTWVHPWSTLGEREAARGFSKVIIPLSSLCLLNVCVLLWWNSLCCTPFPKSLLPPLSASH